MEKRGAGKGGEVKRAGVGDAEQTPSHQSHQSSGTPGLSGSEGLSPPGRSALRGERGWQRGHGRERGWELRPAELCLTQPAPPDPRPSAIALHRVEMENKHNARRKHLPPAQLGAGKGKVCGGGARREHREPAALRAGTKTLLVRKPALRQPADSGLHCPLRSAMEKGVLRFPVPKSYLSPSSFAAESKHGSSRCLLPIPHPYPIHFCIKPSCPTGYAATKGGLGGVGERRGGG
ncbi:uncharacterized protein LOC110196481 isoform X1 [Phascolarctos cinereus]|uniref:Uncharacterized protein LOC110196481 isoform X1 n=1 Tax=Phascolarctos cinereus TaxID=38626 RepID=A0A6P5ITE5_PHACI|nr:uncharacterized protein LOC110196481 isoform X1 [Phascolarctos cinereus]